MICYCEFFRVGLKSGVMSTVATPKKKFSRASLEAGDRLLKAVKEKLLKEHGRIDYEGLRRRGYSEATLSRLKQV